MPLPENPIHTPVSGGQRPEDSGQGADGETVGVFHSLLTFVYRFH